MMRINDFMDNLGDFMMLFQASVRKFTIVFVVTGKQRTQ